jgi:Beta-propeller repeat
LIRIIAAILVLSVTPAVLTIWIGGSADDDCDGIAADAHGYLYLACHSDSADFPGAPKARANSPDFDVYVLKVDPRNGSTLYTTRIGGSSYDGAFRIRIDSTGSAFVVGFTKSRDFPTTADAVQPQFGGGDSDAFLVKVNPEGRVVYSTFLGGSAADQGNALAVDAAGNVYVAGTTWSADFPQVAARFGPGGASDAFIATLRPDTKRVASYIIGGIGDEKLTGIAVGQRGLFAVGYTHSHDFPEFGGVRRGLAGNSDAFLVGLQLPKFDLTWATLFGGSGDDSGWGVAVDQGGNPVIAGNTDSDDLDTTPRAFQRRRRGGSDSFIARFDATALALRSATYFGGSGNDSSGYDGDDITVDDEGNAWFVGMTASRDLPVRGAVQRSFAGGELDGFVAGISPRGSLLQSTYFGGPDRDLLEGVVLTRTRTLYASGVTASHEFMRPAAHPRGAYHGGRFDAFLVGVAAPRSNR